MRIDERVEPLVRAALDATVRRDFGKLEVALQQFRDDESVRGGVELALAVTGLVMMDVHGGMPDSAQIREIAEEIANEETWAAPDADEVETFLRELLNGEPFAAVFTPESAIILLFLVAAYLLSSYRGEGEWWYEYLDRAEAAIELQ